MANNEYVVKNLRLHKKRDKELIEKLNVFSKERKFSEKVKKILSDYFEINKSQEEILLEGIKDKLDNMNFSSNYQSIDSAPVIETFNNKSFGDLMAEDEMGEEEDWF